MYKKTTSENSTEHECIFIHKETVVFSDRIYSIQVCNCGNVIKVEL